MGIGRLRQDYKGYCSHIRLGTGVITIGLLALAPTDVEKHGRLAWVLIVGLLLAMVDLIYFWTTSEDTARNVLVPIIINVVLAAWIWFAQPEG
jgi:hypothetical protein